MAWLVEFHPDFEAEFADYSKVVQDEILALAIVLEEYGPRLGRPHADTLKNSKYANMKEPRLTVDKGEWRVAFAFDPRRTAVCCAPPTRAGDPRRLSTGR